MDEATFAANGFDYLDGHLAAVVRQLVGAPGEDRPELAARDVERHQHRRLARVGRRHAPRRRRGQPLADLVDPARPLRLAHPGSSPAASGRAREKSNGKGATGARGSSIVKR